MRDKGARARTAIVEIARELFHKNGYEATSVGDVADRVGLEKGHLSYYFASKATMLGAVAEAWEVELRGRIAAWEARDLAPADALACFVAMIESQADTLAAYGCPIGTLNDELGKGSLELQAKARGMFDLLLEWLTSRFRDLYPAATARDHAEQLLIMAEGIAVVGHAYRDPHLIRRQTRRLRRWVKQVCDEAR